MKDVESFLKECHKAKCVIAPVRLYTQFNDGGNLSEEYCEGIKYVALPNHWYYAYAAGPEFYYNLDADILGRDSYHDTPEEALKAFNDKKNRKVNGD